MAQEKGLGSGWGVGGHGWTKRHRLAQRDRKKHEEQEQELEHLERWPVGKWLLVEHRQEGEKVGEQESKTQERGTAVGLRRKTQRWQSTTPSDSGCVEAWLPAGGNPPNGHHQPTRARTAELICFAATF